MHADSTESDSVPETLLTYLSIIDSARFVIVDLTMT